MRRMDRYKDETSTMEKRMEKNQELYQDLVNNTKYTNITDVTNANAYDLSKKEKDKSGSREAYQQRKKYQGVEEVPKVKKELEDFNFLYPKKEKKIYDINSVLEEARKNRQEKDELEEKRKLKYTSYNILAGVNLEELMKYREEKKKRGTTKEEDEIHDLMDTIASKTLAGEISKEETVELLSDLMATNMLDKVVPAEDLGTPEETSIKEDIAFLESRTMSLEEVKEEVSSDTAEMDTTTDLDLEDTNTNETEKIDAEAMKELQDKAEEEEPTEQNKTIDNSFYTKSMDLSDKDLEGSAEMSEEFQEKGLPIPLIIFIVLLIIVIVLVAGYFIYLRLK